MSEYSEYAEYAWDELKKHIQAGETFVEGVEKDVAVLTARLIDVARRAENAVLAAIEGVDDTADTVDTTDATEGTDANGSPVSDAAPDAAPDAASSRKRK